MRSDSETRVLLAAATARDGEITRSLLAAESLHCIVCPDLLQLTCEIDAGVGAIILTDEAFGARGLDALLAKLEAQPAWSDIPVVLLMRGDRSAPAAARVLRSLTNVTLLERPAPTRSVVSAVQAAVRGRERQYLIRQQIDAIREVQNRFEAMANFIPQLAWMANPDGWIFWYNRRWHAYTGTTQSEMEGWGWQSVHDPKVLPAVMEEWQASIASGRPFDMTFPLRGADGTFRPFLTRVMPFKNDGQIVLWFGTNTDISQQKRAEEALREGREQLTLALQAGRLGTWQVDLLTGELACSDGCRAHFGLLPGATFTYAMLWEAIVAEDREPTRVEAERAIERKDDFAAEMRVIWPDGTRHWILARGRPICATDGTPVRLTGVTQDITDKKRSAEERERLLDAERAARTDAERASRLKDEFLATLSHELRTPLNAILGWSQILRRRKQNDPELDEALAVIERNSRVQAQLIEDLLDMSRIISGKLRIDVQQLNLGEVVNAAIEAVRPAAEAKEIRLEKVVDTHIEPVRGDPARLQQVVWNLVSNAVKFTPKGGKVQVALERVNSHVEITVTDTGAGIKADFLPYVFERFRQADSTTTRRHGGLGLGLAIVKNLVELHGGRVCADSAGEGMGATFVVALPLMVILASDPAKDRKHPRRLDGKTPEVFCEHDALAGVSVLVVDDEEDARNLVARVLQECKADVIVASSAAEAMELLLRKRPAVLVSDIGMPFEDGYELIRKVRQLSGAQGGHTPAAALTAFARSEDRTRACAPAINRTSPSLSSRLSSWPSSQASPAGPRR